MMTRLLRAPVAIASVLVALSGCNEERLTECAGAEGASGTCAQACAQLYALDCRVGSSEQGCTELCAAAIANLTESVRDRVLACYAVADSCSVADGCGRACGAGGSPVVFESVDAASQLDDAGDAGSGP